MRTQAARLFNANKLSPTELDELKLIIARFESAGPDELYQRLSAFFQKHNLEKRLEELPQEPAAPIVKKETQLTFLQPEEQKGPWLLNRAINYLHAQKKLSQKAFKLISSIQQRLYPEGKLTKEGYETLVRFWHDNNLPDPTEINKQIDAANKTSFSDRLAVDEYKGLDLAKLKPASQKAVKEYVQYLEKLTGKKITFQ